MTLKPSGFLESAGVFRSTTTGDGQWTRFATIPVLHGPGESFLSFRHSRLALDADTHLGPVRLSEYLEADFFNRSPQPFRWRQYWVKVEWRGWELLGGQAWSLLRPNRTGISSRDRLMNTLVVDPSYHVGLIGYRNRQVRLVRTVGNWRAAVSFENGRDWLPKVAHDGKFLHLEVTGLLGGARRRGLSVAGVVHAPGKLDIVAQQFWSKGGGRDALSITPPGVRVLSTLEGVEWKAREGLRLFAYGGLVYGGRSAGNRRVTETTMGFAQDVMKPNRYGSAVFSGQFSRMTRNLWTNANGEMNMAMLSVRYYLGAR